jgi:hypothetical protein
MAQTERPQSARGESFYLLIATQVGYALRLVPAGVKNRVTAVISKAEVLGGQFSVVLIKHHREARKTARAPHLSVCRFALVSGGCTR